MKQSEHTSPNGTKFVKLHEARKILGISTNKMAYLISNKILSFETDPLDRRVKLVRLKDVEALRQMSRQRRSG